MKLGLFRNVVLAGILLSAMSCLGCGVAADKGVQGTYANDTIGVVVELKSGGKATFQSSLGDNDTCTYKVDGNQLTLDCKHDKVVFTINGDGSLTAPFFGTLRKSKK